MMFISQIIDRKKNLVKLQQGEVRLLRAAAQCYSTA